MADDHNILTTEETRQTMIRSFINQVASSPYSRELARIILETRRWDLNSAVSICIELIASGVIAEKFRNGVFSASNLGVVNPVSSPSPPPTQLRPPSPSPPPIQLRPPSPSPPPIQLRPPSPYGASFIPRFSSYSGEQEHYSIDEVQKPVPLSCEILSVEPEVVPSNVTVWRNGLTFNNIMFGTLDDPKTATFLQNIESLESPRFLNPEDGKLRVQIDLRRRDNEDFPESPPRQFEPLSLGAETTTPAPSDFVSIRMTTILLRLAEGTRFVFRFGTHHTIRDLRNFIDRARPGVSGDYQLLLNVGLRCPPKPLTDLVQTIEQAGVSNCLLTQQF